MIKEIEDLAKAIDLGQQMAEILKKSQLSLLGDPHHVGYERTNASGTVSHIQAKNPRVEAHGAKEETPAPTAAQSKPVIPTSRVTVETTEHEMSHGKMPKGAGRWMFSRNRNIDFANHKEGEDYIITPNMPYSEAKKHAKQWAASKGHGLIWTMP